MHVRITPTTKSTRNLELTAMFVDVVIVITVVRLTNNKYYSGINQNNNIVLQTSDLNKQTSD